MNGVEILASSEVVAVYDFNRIAFLIPFGILFIIGIVSGIIASVQERDWNLFWFINIVTITGGFLFGFLFGHICEIPSEYATEYKVTITDEVKMTDFLEKYEIVGQEGKIYTVREKE